MSKAANLRGYLLVTACYWAFTLSDGALRMLVLLHLHDQGQTALALALLLVPYELAGVVTNLLGGYLGARVGLKAPLVLGMMLQALACALLSVFAAPDARNVPTLSAKNSGSAIAAAPPCAT